MVMVSLNYVKSEGIMSTVSIRKTMGDDYAAIKAAVDQVIADIGGIEDIIKPGYKVIIKPNLVACPTERLSGGVTRWEVCLAIYEAVQAVGPAQDLHNGLHLQLRLRQQLHKPGERMRFDL